MNLLELVKARYSCRSYQEKRVELEKLDYIMECVRLAPSAVLIPIGYAADELKEKKRKAIEEIVK